MRESLTSVAESLNEVSRDILIRFHLLELWEVIKCLPFSVFERCYDQLLQDENQAMK